VGRERIKGAVVTGACKHSYPVCPISAFDKFHGIPDLKNGIIHEGFHGQV
jgi:hypothetical protein